MEVRFDTDSDGFLSQECPSCRQRFKVLFGSGSDKPISFCPYCCHNEHDCWWTPEQIDYIQSAVTDVVVRPELEKFQRQLKSTSNEFFRVEVASNIPDPIVSPVDTDDHLKVLHFRCCGETIKADQRDRYYCIICGGETDMATSDSKKIFLSHKGSDKDMVIDFKDTLEALGYEPWLDEEAMPAGSPVERAILQGMQDSCAVVFFITPFFKDEGYLETEITYAIQEKRKKGDKFVIVTLLFENSGGGTVGVPELLKPYVWKTPNTRLQALREILRALPVALGNVDWKGGTTSITEAHEIPSTASGLSEEAKAILREAVKADGFIFLMGTLGGTWIQVNGKVMNQDEKPRTLARWEEGLEELRRRRYIKDAGHKGEVFKVTKEGYDAADALPDG